MSHHLHRLAFLSTHTSPLAQPGMPKAGGMNVYIAELTRELGQGGCRVDIFTRRDRADGPDVVELAPNVRVVHIAAGPPRALEPLAILPYVDAFTEGVAAFAAGEAAADGAGADSADAPERANPYDIIHSHYWISGLSGADLADRWRRPHVAMFHTLGEVKNRHFRAAREPRVRIDGERAVVRRADRLVCATPHERDFLATLYGAAPARVAVVPAGVDLVRFRPDPEGRARARLGLPEGPLALFVGRLEPLKGADIAIRALATLEDDMDPPATLLVVGGAAAEHAPLRDLAGSLGVGDRVRFVDAVAREVLPDYYRAADVCLVPSYYESFGLVAVEALACGTPVIATRVGGLQYTVRDGQSGYLVSWRCPEPFAERLETLLANPDLRRRFGVAARASVERFGWPRVAGEITAVYEEVLAAHARGDARAG